jgi:hypothetical protein
MSNLQLSLAIGEYDHVRDVLDGTIAVAGVDLTVLRLPSRRFSIARRSSANSTFPKCRSPR